MLKYKEKFKEMNIQEPNKPTQLEGKQEQRTGTEY